MPRPRRRRSRVVVGLILAATLAGLAAWATREWPAWREARSAREALAAGRFEAARAAVERWLEVRPDSAEAHYLRARVALALVRRPELLESLKRADDLGLPSAERTLLQALIDAQFGRHAQALAPLLRAFAEPGRGPDPQLDEALARVAMETYDFPTARTVLGRWVRDAPDDPRPHLWLAEVHRRQGAEPAEVQADYREALRRDPDLAQARLGLADELGRDHRDAEAATHYDAYLAIRPDDAAGQLGAGRNALELGDLDAAARRIDRALELAPDGADAHLERAKIDSLRGDPDASLRHLDKAIALRPFDPALRYNRRLALARLGRRDEAEREQRDLDRLKAEIDRMHGLQERLAASPRDADLGNQLARWMFAHGYDQEGVNWSKKVLNDHPGHPETCRLLADHYERLGRWDLARQYRAQVARPRP